MRKKYLTTSPFQTRKLGKILAKEILKTKIKKIARIIGLEGDLGGGKTTFLQGFASGLGIKEKILSPTFIIMRKFRIESRKRKGESRKKTTRHPLSPTIHSLPSTFYHIDCYRIKKPKEILDLGFKKVISDPRNIVAIEWVDRIQKNLPRNLIKIKFKFVDKNARRLTIFGKDR